MDFYGFDFTPAGVLATFAGAYAAGLVLGAVVALLSSLTTRGR